MPNTAVTAPRSDRQFDPWLLFFGAVTVVTCVTILLVPGASEAGAIGSAAIVVALGPLYWFVARPSRAGIRSNGRRAWIYLGIAVPALVVAVTLNPWANIAMFVVSPQIFTLVKLREASAIFVALNIVVLGSQFVSGAYSLESIWENLVITGGIIVVAIFFSARLSAIATESLARATLIDQLREKQDEIARLSEEQGRSAERERIAREMHDTLAQGFTSIITLGHAVEREIDTDLAAARHHVDLMTTTAQENLQESRRIIAALSPAHLEGASLADAVGRVTARFAVQGMTAATTQVHGDVRPVPAAVDVVLLRVAQEALANIAKHAQATRADVALRYDSDAVVLSVVDDGRGFNPDALGPGFGLSGMRSRLDEVGGSLTLRTSPGAGTSIEARVPIEVGP
jgi:signal transduction histidine kinase